MLLAEIVLSNYKGFPNTHLSPSPSGLLMVAGANNYTHRYERLAADAGVRNPLKNLCHFNATELLRGGVDVATVADRLGHADGGVTTLRFYASGTPSADQRAAEQLSLSLQQHCAKQTITNRGQAGQLRDAS